jgi:hypothetical protein
MDAPADVTGPSDRRERLALLIADGEAAAFRRSADWWRA